ncbi:MAG: hypothetical protein O3A00_18785 [Planctomycetota bacterium]|nr:hypothetical protein [Planctomycetota bacterium]
MFVCVLAVTQLAVGQDSKPRFGISRLFGSKSAQPTEPTNALIQRARQDMARARELAEVGQFEQAIVTARRAQKLVTVSERTTPIRWRATEESPTALIARLEAIRAERNQSPTIPQTRTTSNATQPARTSAPSNTGSRAVTGRATDRSPQEPQQPFPSASPLYGNSRPRIDRVIDRVRGNQRPTATEPLATIDIPDAPIAPDPEAGRVDPISAFEDLTEKNTDADPGFASPLIRSPIQGSSSIDGPPIGDSNASKLEQNSNRDRDPTFELPSRPITSNSPNSAGQPALGLNDPNRGRIAPVSGFGEPGTFTGSSSERPADNQPGPFKAADVDIWTRIPKSAGAAHSASNPSETPAPPALPFPKVEHAIIEEPKIEARPFDVTNRAEEPTRSAEVAPPSPFVVPNEQPPLAVSPAEPANPLLAANIPGSVPPKVAQAIPPAESDGPSNGGRPNGSPRADYQVQKAPASGELGNSGSVWTSALIHVLSTLVGFVLALLFLFRYGSKLGLTLRVEHVNGLPAVANPVPNTSQEQNFAADSSFNDADEDSSEPRRKTVGAIDPLFPFRVVGTTYEDERLAAEQEQAECEQAMIQHIFEQNMDLHRQLTGRDPAA